MATWSSRLFLKPPSKRLPCPEPCLGSLVLSSRLCCPAQTGTGLWQAQEEQQPYVRQGGHHAVSTTSLINVQVPPLLAPLHPPQPGSTGPLQGWRSCFTE